MTSEEGRVSKGPGGAAIGAQTHPSADAQSTSEIVRNDKRAWMHGEARPGERAARNTRARAALSAATAPRVVVRNARLRYPIFTSAPTLGAIVTDMFDNDPKADTRPLVIDALKDINITIEQGERVGVIGHNGAGKSTLLRMIAGVYPLLSGSLEVTGKVQGLFDLGTGFETEATGRENIIYRGLAIGCSPSVIASRVDEIIAFTEIGEFIDYPIRTYSAGMIVRLAFAISTYLEGDILLVDEVFGAGDANFQERASKRMMDLIERAGIFMLVSHDVALIQHLCTRVLWMGKGRLILDGPPELVIELYRRSQAIG